MFDNEYVDKILTAINGTHRVGEGSRKEKSQMAMLIIKRSDVLKICCKLDLPQQGQFCILFFFGGGGGG